MKSREILELLAPARDKNLGIAAINHGADAVYIGASQFGARKQAGNSVKDIEELTRYAHYYNAKVFVAFNTLLFNKELKAARQLIGQLYNAGVDALIVQDMGILEMDLPPIALHASTQTHNFDIERIVFLEKCGFQRIVLARELSLSEITTIKQQTKIELEYFIHGALCVSLSGQCYMSQAQGGRSANRGACAQSCRLPYDLKDATGKIHQKSKHILSLRDLNNANRLQDLAIAGVQSFKIEGRLKGEEYVKNTVGFYRKELDSILNRGIGRKASSGTVQLNFTPDLEKSFNRSSANYFLDGRKTSMASFNTPKSTGKPLGKVQRLTTKGFEIDTAQKLQNGDGLCFFTRKNELVGLRVNVVEGKHIITDTPKSLKVGDIVFRNSDKAFTKLLEKSLNCRKINLNLLLSEYNNGFILTATDEDDNCIVKQVEMEKQLANDEEKARATIIKQLSKVGGSNYRCNEVVIDFEVSYFLSASILNNLRRGAIEDLDNLRNSNYEVKQFPFSKSVHNYPNARLDYKANISNDLAKQFYERHGVTHSERAFELLSDKSEADLMTTRYCVKYELGDCPKIANKNEGKATVNELFIENKQGKFKLIFDCKRCLMLVRSV